jgi:multidrug efflux pump subunit AcrA (membrane-fusion protein)
MFGHRSGEAVVKIRSVVRTLATPGPKTPNQIGILAIAVVVVGGLWLGKTPAARTPAAAAPSTAIAQPGTAAPSVATPLPVVAPPSPAAPQPAPPPATAVAQAQFPGQPPPTIPVVHPKVQTVSDFLEITGNAAAVNQVKLIARVVGYLEQLNFQDGALVKKSDLLVTIQQDQYKAQLQQAQAQLQLQQAALAYAKTEVIRYTALLKKDAATQVDVDHWNFERQSAEANILAAQAQWPWLN